MAHRTFSLWLEFEEYGASHPQPGDDPACDFCNAIITMDGRSCGINIWTFGFIEYTRRFDESTGLPRPEPERFLLSPDLLVERLERPLIEAALSTVLDRDGWPAHWEWHDAEETTT